MKRDHYGDLESHSIVVVVPAYKVEREIGKVLRSMPGFVRHIVVVIDGSPDGTADSVEACVADDQRIVMLNHERNRGVGAAVITGFREAIKLGADLIVKVDGDGQMAPEEIPDLLIPLVEGTADFSKGNRFRDLLTLARMPYIRRVGNMGLGFLAKAATGYWNIFDPTNGFFAARGELIKRLPLEKLDSSYYFEISLLSQLYFLGAVVRDLPMVARYGSEESNLSVPRTLFEFPPKLMLTLMRRILLKYFIYDFSIVSIYVLGGIPLLAFGLIFGIINWIRFSTLGVAAPTGTVMLATLPVILGFQLLLSAIGADLQAVPTNPRSNPM
ncbi:MAG: glycosyltransferase family 2 protein [Anaerolineales bacterium]